MKKLKLDHELAELVRTGKKTSTLRLFDDKDISVNDQLLLIDKVDPHNPSSWVEIGIAIVNQVIERRLGELTASDLDGHEPYANQQAMLADFRRYYGSDVTLQTPAKVIQFTYVAQKQGDRPTDIILRSDKAIIYADGGSRGNPGPSASGYVIYDDNQAMLVYRGIYIGITTNNQAEYTALKLGLEEARNIGAQEVHVYMDSLLVINQMRGIFKVKNRDLWPIHDAVTKLVKDFKKVSFTQIPRESNKLADKAVNQALDEQLRHATA
jgi:ribonuclease HI